MPTKKTAAKFEKINSCDDWGNIRYYLGPIKYSSSGTVSQKDQDETRLLKNGDKLVVKLPNGKTAPAIAKVTQYTNTVMDMGHTYPAPAERLEIVLLGPVAKQLKGLGATSMSLDLSKLKARRA
jgi:hypothetical protein